MGAASCPQPDSRGLWSFRVWALGFGPASLARFGLGGLEASWGFKVWGLGSIKAVRNMLHVTACSDRAAAEMVLPLHAARIFLKTHALFLRTLYPCRSVGRSGSGCGAATAAASAAAADVMAATRRPCPARAHVRSGDHELACLAQASADRSQQGPPASAGTSRQLAVTPGWLSACLHPATARLNCTLSMHACSPRLTSVLSAACEIPSWQHAHRVLVGDFLG